ncbi:TonB-dependent receptor [Longitalea luteola]|uniref:TonB-dependent receptor n=1 Tax=Longitalea luteola TaxID=2812563 RepID=UPI001A9705B6|nr:TonB-dependent receptor [Longitalea luteola]
MKRLFCILVVLLCSFQLTLAQRVGLFARSYTPSFQQGSIRQFLEDINSHSPVIIEYAANFLDTGKVITLQGSPCTIGSVLQQVLQDQAINLLEKHNKLIITPSHTTLPADFFITRYAVYGIIKETVSGEPLVDATVWHPARQRGSYSNNHGYYTLLLPEGKNVIYISYAGYDTRKIVLELKGNTRMDVHLAPKSDIKEVTVTAVPAAVEVEENKASKEANSHDIILGESDALRSFYLDPGVKNIPEITYGMLVRGGSPDQNIFLLDGNPIFNPTHLLGTLSIANKTSLKSMYLYRKNFPARYGGGLSSVIDVMTKDGNMQRWQGEANAGLLAGSFTLEGPVKKDRSSIMVSFRQSWINPILRMLRSGISVQFYDLHLKYTQWVGKRDKIMVNAYAGNDELQLHQNYTNNQQRWGNKAATLNWNRLLSARAFINSSFNVSNYDNIAGFRYNLYDSTGRLVQNRVYNTYSSMQQYNVRTALEFSANNNIRFNVGGKAAYTRIRPFDTNVSAEFMDRPGDFHAFPPLSFSDMVLFYENEFRPNKRLFLRPGLRVSFYKHHDFKYTAWQPRFYAVYKLDQRHQLDVSYNHMTQYLHMVTNPYMGINSDAWVPSTGELQPEESDMINLGYSYRNFKKFILHADVYYKQMRNVTNYAEGKNLFLNTVDWGQSVQLGKGWSYGLETKAERCTDKWYLHLSYTLSWNWRRFAGLNNGVKFPFKYDRRHEINTAATFKYNKHWSFSAFWMFATGDVYSLPNQVYPDFDDAQQIRDPLAPKEYRLIYNSSLSKMYRTLPYHRLDVSASHYHSLGKNLRSRVTAGIYNIYGSPSQYVYDLEGTLGKRSLVVTTKYQYFKVTPYVAYTVTF